MHGLVGDAERHQGEPGGADGGLVGRERRIGQPCLHARQHRALVGQQRAGEHDRPCGCWAHRVDRGEQSRHAPRDDAVCDLVVLLGPGGHHRRQLAERGRGHGVRLGDHVLDRVRRRTAQQALEQRLGQGGRRATAVESGHHGDQRLARQPHRRADVAEEPARAIGLSRQCPVGDGRGRPRRCPRRAPRRTAGGSPRRRRPPGRGRPRPPRPVRAGARPRARAPGPRRCRLRRPRRRRALPRARRRGRARRAPPRSPGSAGPPGHRRWTAG